MGINLLRLILEMDTQPAFILFSVWPEILHINFLIFLLEDFCGISVNEMLVVSKKHNKAILTLWNVVIS